MNDRVYTLVPDHLGGGVTTEQTLSAEDAVRKATPLATGCLDYFPDALAAVAELSMLANEKHNPGEPMHWSKDKSTGHADSLLRHLVDRGKWDHAGYSKPVRHSTEVAWRALANLQIEIEAERALRRP
jgi:hypothetical protein